MNPTPSGRSKLDRRHLERRAVVYLRQSTMKQVHEHRESTARQYDLKQRAVALGWPGEHVQIVDHDLGQSGTTTEGRSGFQQLAEDVSRGQVGAIFALEVSRLARSSADWHHLLDLCGWADVLIADEYGLYSPNDPNDRLLLGLKGQMSEAERYWMRLRLYGARMNKARRGELRIGAPVGYVWDPTAMRLRLDPDDEIRQAIEMVFERYRIDRTSGQVIAYFVKHGIRIPVRQADGEIAHRPAYRRLVLNILHSPVYAGAYVYGRRESRTAFVDGELKRSRMVELPMAEWKVCLQGHHPAYISWEEFLSNRETLDANRNRSGDEATTVRPPRKGRALLQGIALCGQCGCSMGVQQNGTSPPRYVCSSPQRRGTGTKPCWIVSGSRIDAAVTEAFLNAASPPQIELSLAVTREVERQAHELDAQWQRRLERANYEARLAQRRYMAVDPDNRVVARTLERDWEEKLRDVERLDAEHQRVRRERRLELTDSDRAQIVALSSDLPRAWRAPSTSNVQRKNLLRILVEVVTLTPVEVPGRSTRIQIQWRTGAVTDLCIDRPRHPPNNATPATTIEQIRRYCEQRLTDREIAEQLNQAGLRTGTGGRWSDQSVRSTRKRRGIQKALLRGSDGRLPTTGPEGMFSVRGLAQRFDVRERQIRDWVGTGRIRPAEGGGGTRRPMWFRLDDELARTLTALTGGASRTNTEPPDGGGAQ